MGIEECICSLKYELTSDSMLQQIDQFLAKAEYASKWMLYSDYCLDNKSKPNDATIVGRITIGDDVLIAPNSYVNRDVPSHSVVFGNPCVIKSRPDATAAYINHKI